MPRKVGSAQQRRRSVAVGQVAGLPSCVFFFGLGDVKDVRRRRQYTVYALVACVAGAVAGCLLSTLINRIDERGEVLGIVSEALGIKRARKGNETDSIVPEQLWNGRKRGRGGYLDAKRAATDDYVWRGVTVGGEELSSITAQHRHMRDDRSQWVAV